jgi:hypothetical protein
MASQLPRPAVLCAALLTILSCGAGHVSAEPIWAIPVSGAGSTTAVGIYEQLHDATPIDNDPSAHWIKYYIPLSPGTSGTYGVNAGTTVDTGSGNSYLYMYLMFAPVTVPAGDATLSFEFSDLDLNYINDPSGFLETMQLYSDAGGALSPKFTSSSGSGSNGVFSTALGDVNWTTSRTAGSEGKNWPFNATFTGPGLDALVDDPFWLMLKFTVPSTFYGTNTPEYLRASLDVTAEPIPEPGTLLLLGTALVAARTARAARRRRTLVA